MNTAVRLVFHALLVSVVLSHACPAAAQYMFFDTNGDSVWTQDDVGYTYGAPNEPTTLDLYLVSNQNADGSPAYCTTGVQNITSYTVNLRATQAAVNFSNVTNMVPGMTEIVPLSVHPYALTVGYGGGDPLPAGRHLLLRFTVSRQEGDPYCSELRIETASCFSPPGVVTSFGTTCTSLQGDSLFRLGEDWLDIGWYGSCLHPANMPPVITAPASVEAREGESISFTTTVMDPECGAGSFWFDSYGYPPGASMSPITPFVGGEASVTFSWTPTVGQAGEYDIQFVAYDEHYPYTSGPDIFRAATHITVRPAPVVHAVRVFATPSQRVTRLPNGKSQTCIEIEPEDATFTASEIDPSVSWVRYVDPVCGEVTVYPEPGKSASIHDSDRNGLAELELCFSRDALSSVAACLAPGRSVVPLQFSGRLLNGDLLRGDFTHTFVLGQKSLIASISPNPVNSQSVMEFTTTREGPVSIRLFDSRGRLVATLVDSRSFSAGYHRVEALGANSGVGRLAAGVYFLRLVTRHDGAETKRIAVFPQRR